MTMSRIPKKNVLRLKKLRRNIPRGTLSPMKRYPGRFLENEMEG